MNSTCHSVAVGFITVEREFIFRETIADFQEETFRHPVETKADDLTKFCSDFRWSSVENLVEILENQMTDDELRTILSIDPQENIECLRSASELKQI